MSRVVRSVEFILRELDLIALIFAGVAFTILGAFGIANVATLSSVVLALLTLLAFAQVRTRRQLIELQASVQSASMPRIVLSEHPAEEARARRQAATDYLFLGTSMRRAARDGAGAIMDILSRGGRVRILVLNPQNSELVKSAAMQTRTTTPDQLVEWIRGTLSELQRVKNGRPGQLLIRTVDFVPRFGAHAIDMSDRSGALYLQHYEFRPTDGEPTPIFRLKPEHGYWYHHMTNELERIWAFGNDWET